MLLQTPAWTIEYSIITWRPWVYKVAPQPEENVVPCCVVDFSVVKDALLVSMTSDVCRRGCANEIPIPMAWMQTFALTTRWLIRSIKTYSKYSFAHVCNVLSFRKSIKEVALFKMPCFAKGLPKVWLSLSHMRTCVQIPSWSWKPWSATWVHGVSETKYDSKLGKKWPTRGFSFWKGCLVCHWIQGFWIEFVVFSHL